MISLRSVIFPWRVYMRFVVLQSTLLALFLLCWSACAIWAFELKVDHIKILLLLFLVGLIASVCLSFWMGRKFFLPLGRLVEKTRSLRARKAMALIEEESEVEWDVVENAIEQFQSDLRQTFDRLSEGRGEFKTLMSALDDAIVAFDQSGRSLFYNERFSQIFLLPHEQGKDVHLVNVFRDANLRQAFQIAQRNGERVNILSTLIPVGDTDPRDYQVAVAPLSRTHQSDDVYGVIAIFHDIFDLKQAERIRIEFVGNASHELRTPLTSIKGYLATLHSDVQQGRMEDLERFLTVISRNVDRLIALVNDLLDLSTLESHSQAMSFHSVSTMEVTEAVLKSLENEMKEKQQTLSTAFAAEQVLGDARKIEQVITNLVANAIKYIPKGGTIQVIWESAGDAGVYLRVIDNGPGIAKKHLPRIFERFYRVDEGRSREAGGTGLGLAIVKHIMLNHAGWVKVSSEIGKNTEFTCFFPWHKTTQRLKPNIENPRTT